MVALYSWILRTLGGRVMIQVANNNSALQSSDHDLGKHVVDDDYGVIVGGD